MGGLPRSSMSRLTRRARPVGSSRKPSHTRLARAYARAFLTSSPAYSPPEKIGCIRKDSLAFFAITSPSVHSVQRPENINNLYPVDTSRRESKRANAHRDWSHLALRKPATSRPVDGRYGVIVSAVHGRRIFIQTLHPASGTTCI